ncbi:MAG: ABC transporter substrate-binding protein [Acetobacteraceae bacterium]|jgi:ABC-type branched-subunit amino acid transport system substrate-binding protein
MLNRYQVAALSALLLGSLTAQAVAETAGITASEIKIGQNAPFSGSASVYGQISTAETDYFKMINDQGGINGRKIVHIALDDGYSPLYSSMQACRNSSVMSIRKAADIDWHPLYIIDSNGTLVKPALTSSGIDKSVMTAQYLKDPTDPGWNDDPGMKEFLAWRAKYAPESDLANPVWVYGYPMAQALLVVLKPAGKDLTRESITHAATNLPDTTTLPMVLPGIKIGTSPTDYRR